MSPPSASAAEKPSSIALVRQLGVASATALVVSNMIGTGIFTSTGFMAGDLGSVGLIFLIWAVGALCALAGAFCYSELGVNFPASGGEYVYLTKAYGPVWGFITGWVSFFAGFSAPIAAAALAFADYLGYFFPAVKQANAQFMVGPEGWQFKVGGAQAAACGLILLTTLINLLDLRRVAGLQNVLTGTKVAVLAAFLLLGFSAGTGNWGNFSLDAARTSSMPLAAQFAVSLFWVYASYSGWNAATYVAEEIKNPARTLPIALALGTGLVAIFYLLLNAVFIYATPLEQMKGTLAVGSLAASRLFGPEIAGMFAALMALALVSTVNAMVVIGPRVYYAMARNGAFFPFAAEINEKIRTPLKAILLQALCAMVMTLTPFPSLVVFIGFILNFMAMMSVASLFKFRNREGWQKLKVVNFLWPLWPALFILVAAVITLVGLQMEPKISFTAVALILAGAAVFKLKLERKGA